MTQSDSFCDSVSQRRIRKACFHWCFCMSSTIHTIFEGTSEIQQLVIARAISGLRVE